MSRRRGGRREVVPRRWRPIWWTSRCELFGRSVVMVCCLTSCGNVIFWRALIIFNFVFYMTCWGNKLLCAVVAYIIVSTTKGGYRKNWGPFMWKNLWTWRMICCTVMWLMMVVGQSLEIGLPFCADVPIYVGKQKHWQCFASVVFARVISRLHCLLHCLVRPFQVLRVPQCQRGLNQDRAPCCPVIPRTIFLTNFDSTNSCVELLGTLAGTALQCGYEAWSNGDYHDKDRILKALMIR